MYEYVFTFTEKVRFVVSPKGILNLSIAILFEGLHGLEVAFFGQVLVEMLITFHSQKRGKFLCFLCEILF